METELKLRFPSKESLIVLWNQEWFQDILLADTVQTDCFATTYYDTKARDLSSFRASIRVRKTSHDGYIHTVKIARSAKEGLHQRLEWNYETDDDTFDPEIFRLNAVSDGDPATELEDVLKAVEGKELLPLCQTNFTRQYALAGYGDSLLEVAMDTGTLEGGSRTDEICELEIELKQGDVRDILALGDFIQTHTDAVRDDRGKYSRCLILLGEI